MDRKHQASPETLNEYFAPDLARYCAKHGYTFDAPTLQTLWLVVASAGSDGKHIPEAMKGWYAARLFRFVTAANGLECLAVMVEMHRLLAGLNEQDRRALVGQDHYRTPEVSRSHRKIAKKQAGRTKRKSG